MIITIHEDPAFAETEVVINCREQGAEVQRLLAMLRSSGGKLIGSLNGETHLVDPAALLYCESVDKRSFLYTADGVYESPLRLYEVEQQLAGEDCFRASKSLVVNIARIRSLRPELGGRLELTMQNGERLVVSRQYATALKQKIGLR